MDRSEHHEDQGNHRGAIGSLRTVFDRRRRRQFPPYGVVYDVTYYSDYTLTTRIGNERWMCTGYLHWGQTSIYKVENTWPCQEEQ